VASARPASRRFDACVVGRHWAAERYLRERSSTTVPSFVDTTVLVYAEDRDARAKHGVARDLLVDLWTERSGVLSVSTRRI